MVSRLMAMILGALGRERRHGNGAFTMMRRSTDPETRKLRVAEARIEAQADRLRAYQRVQFPR